MNRAAIKRLCLTWDRDWKQLFKKKKKEPTPTGFFFLSFFFFTSFDVWKRDWNVKNNFSDFQRPTRRTAWSSETAQTQDMHVIVTERGQTCGLKAKPDSERRRHSRPWSFINPFHLAGTPVLMSRAAPVYRIVAQVPANGCSYTGSDHKGSEPVIEFIPAKWMGNLSSRHSDGGLTSAFKTDFSNIRAQRKRGVGGGGTVKRRPKRNQEVKTERSTLL